MKHMFKQRMQQTMKHLVCNMNVFLKACYHLNALPPDIMNDLLEGVLPVTLEHEQHEVDDSQTVASINVLHKKSQQYQVQDIYVVDKLMIS